MPRSHYHLMFTVATVLAVSLVPASAFAAILFGPETFSTPSANAEATYPAFTFVRTPAPNGTATAAAGQLNLNSSGTVDGGFVTDSTFAGPLEVQLDLGMLSTNSVGNTTVGLAIGNRVFHFFPGFPGGAFRVWAFNPATGAFRADLIPGNVNMGFTPAVGSLHHMEVTSDGIGGFSIFIDDANSASTFNYIFAAGGFVAGPIGPAYKSFTGSIMVGGYDNFVILNEVPEPSTLALFGLGSIGLAIKTRRRR